MDQRTRIQIITTVLAAVLIGFTIVHNWQKKVPLPTPVADYLSQTYSGGSKGFSLRYPAGYAVDEKYTYQALGPNKDIHGVKFTIPASLAAGTNLSTDSYISVEEIPNTPDCSASPFVPAGTPVKTANDNDTEYFTAEVHDAAAGNRYDETIYALPGTNPCIAVRYFIHYGVFENFEPGTIKQFDEQTLTAEFDQIRRTLVINQ